MTDTKKNWMSKLKIDGPTAIISVMMILTALTGLFNQTILSMGIVFCCGLLMFQDKLYLGFPFVIFYNSFYGMVFGMSVLRIYTFLMLANMILIKKEQSIKAKHLIPMLIYSIYVAIVMIPAQGGVSALFILLDVITVFVLTLNLIDDDVGALKDFFRVYVVVALISFLSGALSKNAIGNEYNYYRFMATFEDPNYMGFFFTVAVFALVTLKLFDKRVRWMIIIALYTMILTTLSMTAIVVNIVLWMFYLVIMKKLTWKSVVLVVFIVLLAISLFNYGLSNPDTPVLGDAAARIDEKLDSLKSGDMGDVTTNRTDHVVENFGYYIDLPILNLLFGGIPVNTRYIHPDLKGAAHNEYVDMLLNIGFIGTVIMLAYFISNAVYYIKKYKEDKEDKYLFLIMGKMIWICYSLALTTFLDFRFMFFLL